MNARNNQNKNVPQNMIESSDREEVLHLKLQPKGISLVDPKDQTHRWLMNSPMNTAAEQEYMCGLPLGFNQPDEHPVKGALRRCGRVSQNIN